jgi:RNAse (barnase) inhibitor barstar
MLTCILSGDEGGLENIYSRLASDLQFRDYFGKNLDALEECLADVSEARIVWNNARQAEIPLGEAFPKLVAVIEDAARQNPNLTLELR